MASVFLADGRRVPSARGCRGEGPWRRRAVNRRSAAMLARGPRRRRGQGAGYAFATEVTRRGGRKCRKAGCHYSGRPSMDS